MRRLKLTPEERSARRKAANKRWTTKSKGRIEEYKNQNRERIQAYKRYSYSGFTQALVDYCREVQGGRCALCTVRFLEVVECADHIEVEGVKVQRGLLCDLCNRTLGFYEATQKARGLVIEVYDRYIACPPARGYVGPSLWSEPRDKNKRAGLMLLALGARKHDVAKWLGVTKSAVSVWVGSAGLA